MKNAPYSNSTMALKVQRDSVVFTVAHILISNYVQPGSCDVFFMIIIKSNIIISHDTYYSKNKIL